MALLSTVCVLVIIVCTFTDSDETLATSADFKKCFKGKALRTLYNLSLNKCGSECKLRPTCAAANYWRNREKCELLDVGGTATLALTEEGASCMSISRSDLPEVDGCRECTDGIDCAPNNDSCKIIECPSLTVINGTVKGNMQNVGAKQKVICDENFRLEPANARPVCEADGNWSVVPWCISIINCSEPTQMDNATLDTGDTHEGAMRTYTCHDNYTTATGSTTIAVTCKNNGDWTSWTETCLRNCREPTQIYNAILDTGDTYEGVTRTYTCHDNYITDTGSTTIAVTCTYTGDWTTPTETCLRITTDCAEPTQMDNATLDTGDTNEGATRTYTCHDNYITAKGSKSIAVTCTNTGDWTPLTEICLRNCSEPSQMDNAVLSTGDTHEGAMRTYTCHDNYTTTTGSTTIDVTCTNTGNWTPPNETCLRTCTNTVGLVTGLPYSGNLITATSSIETYLLNVRLNLHFVWVAAITDIQQHIQFELPQTQLVNGIVTKGSPHSTQNWWVTSYKIHYSADCDAFTEYNKIFQGNTDGTSEVSNEINPAIFAKCVRVNPWTWHENIALRVELLGC